MLKKDLENEIARLNKLVSTLYKDKTDLQEMILRMENELEESKQQLSEAKYEAFTKSEQGIVFERMIHDFIKNNLSIDVDCDWGGHVDVNLKLAGKTISSDYGNIVTRSNPLDE